MYYIYQTIVDMETGDCDVTEIHVALFTQKRDCVVTTEPEGNDVTENLFFEKSRILKDRLIVITATKIKLIIRIITITTKIFMVTPCINSHKYFIIQLMHLICKLYAR